MSEPKARAEGIAQIKTQIMYKIPIKNITKTAIYNNLHIRNSMILLCNNN